MSELPKGWANCLVGDILYLKNGNAFKSTAYQEIGIPIIRISDIKDGFVSTENSICVDESLFDDRFAVSNGDVLIAMSGATTGKFGVYEGNEKVLQNQRVGNLKPYSEKLTSKEFIYYLCSVLKPTIIELAYGGAQPNISSKLIEGISIPLPPLLEQERIVEELDALFASLDVIKDKLGRIPELLKNFRQQVLTQAVTGKLTEEWREKAKAGGKEYENDFYATADAGMRDLIYDIPNEWYYLSFGQVAQIKSNLVDPQKYRDFPLVAPDNIQSETGKLINVPLVSDVKPKSAKHLFFEGNIVYSKIRPYLSKLIIADFDGLCSADMYPITTDLDIKYLFYYLLSDNFLRYATTAGERSVLPKINQKGLGVIPVPTPGLKEQQEIVRRVEELFAIADRVEAQYITLKERVDQLPHAILAKAFRGELVEQDEEDESAEVLLERIKVEREATLSKKVTNKKKSKVQ